MSPLSGFEQNINGELIYSNQIISEHGGPENQWWIFNYFDGDIELQEGRSIDQHGKVNWPPVDGAQTDGKALQ